ncbi:MAG: hypothetical protein P4K97_04565 [Terracidiphilus sp.]|nr:hypothetical protein [Terracidiphilus sp.]
MVFDPLRNRFFVSDPGGNRIVVLDAATESEIATIPVPGAYGIDETTDHSVLYAGTQIGDVYAINPATMQVTKRYMAAQIGPSGYQAFELRALASGELALLGGQGGIPGVDGYNSIGLWDPSTNALTVHNNFSHLGAFTLTGDRSLIVVGGLQSPGGFCTLNPGTGNVACANASNSTLYSVATTPDGKSILLPDYSSGQVVVYDAKTLAQTSAFAVKGELSSTASMIVSPDSTTLYMGGGGMIYAYNIATGAQIGWMPNLTLEPILSGGAAGPIASPNLQAFDNTGLLAGPMEQGVGFLDTSTLQTGPVGSAFPNDYIVPATGPMAGGTAIRFQGETQSAKMSAVYLGGNPATSLSQGSGEFYATTPKGSAGPADLYAIMADGGMLIVPEAFSYGPAILEVTPDAATAEGGGTGTVYGYGLGSTEYNSPIPTDLKIAVGGKSVAVTGYSPNAYGLLSPPFNLQAATYTIPPGTAGTSADVEVTTPSGTATASNALQYMPAVQQFPLTGASLVQGIYDAKRSLYYFTDASQIRVFSRTQGQWLSPILLPAAPVGMKHRLWGIALSPDGSKLAVSDAGDGMIYFLNPDSTSTVDSFGFGPAPYGGVAIPAGLAVSDSEVFYVTFASAPVDYTGGHLKIVTSSGKVVACQIFPIGSSMARTVISSDDARVFLNIDGSVFSVNTATGDETQATVDPGCCYGDYDLTLSAGQTTLEATSYLYNTNLNAESYLVLNDRDALNIAYVYGAKLSPDGALLFQPSTNGIDVFDGRVGTLRARVSLPVALSENFDALVSDGTDNVLIAITGQTSSSIAVVDLSSLAVPAPLPYLRSQTPSDFASLQGSGTTTAQPQLHRDSNMRAGQQIPTTVGKHQAKRALWNKDGVVKRAGPAN